MCISLYVKCRLLLPDFYEKLNFLERFSTNNQISNFMKIHPVGAELFHAGGRRDRHDEIIILHGDSNMTGTDFFL